MTNKCQAKNPSLCPYHGSIEQKQTLKTINIYEDKLSRALTINEYIPLKAKLDNLSARLDSTQKGYKQLSKDLKKSLRNGTIDEKTSLARRYEKATIERAKEGYGSEKNEDDSYFAQQVISESAFTDVVYVPSSRAKTRGMSMLYHQLQAEGYAVTELEIHPIGSDRKTPEELNELSKETVSWLEDNNNRSALQLTSARRTVFSGLTFINSKGRAVKVQGSYEVN